MVAHAAVVSPSKRLPHCDKSLAVINECENDWVISMAEALCATVCAWVQPTSMPVGGVENNNECVQRSV